MKRATGPGKVEELLAPPGRDDLVQGALLFNFDLDDDAVKPEHKSWLDANAVPLLKPENGARAFLNGMASQLGAADYNRELSRRREENVKHFLTSRGVSPGRLTTTFSGEDLSTSRLEDDEHDRAVGVWLQVVNTGRPRVIPNTPSPADTFQAPPEFDAPRLRLGFALGGSPVFANVLPSLIPSTIELRPNEDRSCTVINAAGREMFLKKEGTPTSSSSHFFAPAKLFDPRKPESQQDGKVKIVESPQVVNVRGLSAGRCDVVFTNPASQFVDIVGTVNVLLDVKVFFHFVDGPPGIKTNRPLEVEAAFIRAMNRVYRSQTAIVFASAGANPSLTVQGAKPRKDASGKVGLPVLSGGRTPEQFAVVSNRKSDVLFNVFLIGDMVDLTGALSGDPGEDFLGLTSQSDTKVTPPRCCLLRDPQPRDPPGIKWGEVLAHEAGHALDQDDIRDDPRKDHLMFFSASQRTGVKIPSANAFFMLKSAQKFPP